MIVPSPRTPIIEAQGEESNYALSVVTISCAIATTSANKLITVSAVMFFPPFKSATSINDRVLKANKKAAKCLRINLKHSTASGSSTQTLSGRDYLFTFTKYGVV